MYDLSDIKTITPNGICLKEIIFKYIREKNLNFIVDQGQCANTGQAALSDEDLARRMEEFSACGFAKVSCPDLRPSPPFLAAAIDGTTARVTFLIDLTREAETGFASKFYSKILGALSTQFFAHSPEVSRLFFPFELEDTLGRGLTRESCDGGTFIVRD